MKIAVITPVFQNNRAWLEKCLGSVRGQTIPCTHLLVNDGSDSLKDEVFPGVEVFHLPKHHMDYGITAFAIGAISAMAQGFDAISYLSVDHWFEADHLQRMVGLHERTGAAVCTAARNLVDLDGQLLGRCFEVDGDKYADINSLFITSAAFELNTAWLRIPRPLAAIADRLIWKAIQDAKISHSHNSMPTVNFRTPFVAHYTYFHKMPPPGAKHVHLKVNTKGEYVSAEISDVDSNKTTNRNQNDGGLGQRSRYSEPLSEQARVSLCMIVKNEEANLADCLTPVADLFHEIIVVDTGSTDGTKETAHRFGAKVYDFTWVDSFAAARNESLRHATGDWIFWLDGDDRLDEANLQKLKRLLANLPKENNAYLMCQWSAPDQATGTSLVVDQTRLFRNLPNVKWTYRVHEQILVPLKKHGARDIRTDIVIHHLGYQDFDTRQSKRGRNIRLLHLELEENSQDGFVYFNLANAYLDASKAEEALAFMKRCLEYAPPGSSYLPKVYFMLAGASHLLGRDDESLQYCRQGKRLFPKAVDLWFHEGVLLLAKGDLPGAQNCFETILKIPRQETYVGMDPELPGARTRHNLAFIYRRLGLKQNAEEQWLITIENSPQFEPAWLALLELYLEQKKQREAEGLLRRLDGNPVRQTIEPALLARLAVAKGDIAGARRILEEALARIPKALWLRILLADILLRVANDDKAAELHLREILAISPNEQQTRRKLTQLLAKRNG